MASRRRRMQQAEAWRINVQQQLVTANAMVQLIDEEEQERRPRGGSVVGREVVPRDRFSGYLQLMADYFLDRPVFSENFFRRRFCMMKCMYLDICHAVAEKNRYFQRKCNAAGLPGFATVHKVTVALRVLAYGGPADRLEEYIRMGQSTILESVNEFTRTIVDIFGLYYLREPNADDVASLLQKAEERGFPGMLGSLNCMHWEWERCPNALHGQYRGHYKKLTIILEAIASWNLWIWHAFFGLPGSLNDINVLHRSPLFDNLARGIAPEVNYTANGRNYNMGYYLADGIYPPWATLIGPISSPQSNKHKYFAAKQAEYRKDVERAFGVLQAKFAIIKGPARLWNIVDLKYIVDCVIILHNMGIMYEQGLEELQIEDYEGATVPRLDANRNVPKVGRLIARHRQIQSRPAHEQLKADLTDHVWSRFGGQ